MYRLRRFMLVIYILVIAYVFLAGHGFGAWCKEHAETSSLTTTVVIMLMYWLWLPFLLVIAVFLGAGQIIDRIIGDQEC